MKKSEVLEHLQEYLRTGTRTITKLELNLVIAEKHIRKLESSDDRQELNIANENIKRLESEIQEFKKNPHTAQNASERAIENLLHRITTTDGINANTCLGTIKQFEEKWGNQGTTEQKNAWIKYKPELERVKPFLEWLKQKWIKDNGLEKIIKEREREGKSF